MTGQPRHPEPIDTAGAWARLLAGLVAVFALFQWMGHVLESDRGQAGWLIAAAVVAALIGVERVLFARPAGAAAQGLGLGRPDGRGMLAAAIVGTALLAVLPLYGLARGSAIALLPSWLVLLPGLFAQAGIAEEVLFRGYLFGRLQQGRTFWRAALLSMLPFLAVHLILFATLPWPVALASVALAAAISFPLAHLYVLAGNTIWAPALLHLVVQGGIKVVAIPEADAAVLPVVWIAASAALPFLVFLVPRERR